MIELIFSDSVAATLALAKETGDKSHLTVVEIVTDRAGDHQKMNRLVPDPYCGPTIAGDVADIVSLWLMGDIGDISETGMWNARLDILRRIEGIDDGAEDGAAWVDEVGESTCTAVARLQNAAVLGEKVRIWWSDSPEETCGYYWALHLLKDAVGDVTSVKLPHLWPEGCGEPSVRGTSELLPEDFYRLQERETVVLRPEREVYARIWDTLVAENAPLRAIVDGLPRSVQEHFYDDILYSVFPDGTFKVAYALGTVLTQEPLGVSIHWYTERIKHMLAVGELEMVGEHETFYFSDIRKKRNTLQ